MDRAKAFSLNLHLLPCGLCLLILTTVAKNLEISTCKEDERDCIRLLSKGQPRSYCHILLPKFKNHALSGLNSVIQLLFPWSQFCHSVQTMLFYYRLPCFTLWGKNFEGRCFRFLHQKHFQLQSPRGNEVSSVEKVLVSSVDDWAGDITAGKKMSRWIQIGSLVSEIRTSWNLLL